MNKVSFKEELWSEFSLGACSRQDSFCPTRGWQWSARRRSALGLPSAAQTSSGLAWSVQRSRPCCVPRRGHRTHRHGRGPAGCAGLTGLQRRRAISARCRVGSAGCLTCREIWFKMQASGTTYC